MKTFFCTEKLMSGHSIKGTQAWDISRRVVDKEAFTVFLNLFREDGIWKSNPKQDNTSSQLLIIHMTEYFMLGPGAL